MTQFIEKRLAKRLSKAYYEEAQNRGIPLSEVDKCPPLVLRQVSSMDKMQPVRDGVRERYKFKNYPIEFPCRTKCVVLFQSIDGQDVILFGMYVYEYGHKCPAPNQRRVYVSYLDSVHYFRPKQYRTLVYHEILIAYLDYVKRRGFHTAHIWSCPPSKGDDYILYCHPNDQKTPKTDKLQKWYADMLDECQKRGIIEDITDLHAEFLVDSTYDATILPYFEGDYWTTEAEVIIKNVGTRYEVGKLPDSRVEELDSSATTIEDKDSTIVDEKVSKNSIKSKRKSKSTPRPPRSSKSVGSSLITRSDRDPVMMKLASIIEPMKNTFFVARLRSKDYAEQCSLAREKVIILELE
jgi:E1A/CREB-binding protein